MSKPEGKIPSTPARIAAAGLIIDVPMEASSPDPQPLRYEELGDDKKWRQPDQTQPESGNDVASEETS